MTYHIEVVPPLSRNISVTVSAEEVNAELNAAARSLGAGLTLPGFRKGKAPIAVIEKRFKADVQSSAVEALIKKHVDDILAKETIKPLSRVEYHGSDPITRGKDFCFSFTFETMPEGIKLPEDLSSLSVNMDSSEVTQEDIDDLTLRLQKMTGHLEDVQEERLPQTGDFVTVNVKSDLEGSTVPFMNMEGTTYRLGEIGEDKNLSAVDTVVRTLHVGEEGTGSIDCAPDHPNEAIRGKTVTLHIQLSKISREVLPEINDDYAKKMGFADLAAFNRAVSEQASVNKAQSVRKKAEDDLLESLLEGQNFPLPASVVKRQEEESESELREYFRQRGIEKEAADDGIKSMEEEIHKRGEKNARVYVFLMALALREKLAVTQQEIDLQILNLAREYNKDVREIRKTLYETGAVNEIYDRLLVRNAMNLIFDKAQKITPAKESEAPAEAPEAPAE